EEGLAEARRILEQAEELFEEYRDVEPGDVADALFDVDQEGTVHAQPDDDRPALEATAAASEEEKSPDAGPGTPTESPGATGADRLGATGADSLPDADGSAGQTAGELDGETAGEVDGELDGTTVAGELDGDTAAQRSDGTAPSSTGTDPFGTESGSVDGEDAELEELFEDIDGGDEGAASPNGTGPDSFDSPDARDDSADEEPDDVPFGTDDDVTFDEPSFDTGEGAGFDGSDDATSAGDGDGDGDGEELDGWGFGPVDEEDAASDGGATDGGESADERDDAEGRGEE
ncbi:MAG: hypothetical protein V5A46_09840, partial [Haloferacaceae archaeon]